MGQPERIGVQVWRGATYTTMRTVCATALLGRLVDLDVLDD